MFLPDYQVSVSLLRHHLHRRVPVPPKSTVLYLLQLFALDLAWALLRLAWKLDLAVKFVF